MSLAESWEDVGQARFTWENVVVFCRTSNSNCALLSGYRPLGACTGHRGTVDSEMKNGCTNSIQTRADSLWLRVGCCTFYSELVLGDSESPLAMFCTRRTFASVTAQTHTRHRILSLYPDPPFSGRIPKKRKMFDFVCDRRTDDRVPVVRV